MKRQKDWKGLLKSLKAEVQTTEQELEEMRKDGEELRLKEQSLKGDLRDAELEEKNINDRLAIYDLEKGQYSEEKAFINEPNFGIIKGT